MTAGARWRGEPLRRDHRLTTTGMGMADVFERLAQVLDGLPHGFPATDSGVELAILRKIFTPDDAAVALRLKPLPETAAMVARRFRRPTDEVRATLDRMAERGEIFSFRQRGRRYYALAPFIVGIWELQLDHIDRELAELFEAYAPTLLGALGCVAPALARVIPVNRRIEARAEILPHDDLKALLERCESFRVADCLCRREQALLGKPCSHSIETCMSFSREPNAYEGSPPWGREITRQEALELLDRVEEEGLVHCTYNVQRRAVLRLQLLLLLLRLPAGGQPARRALHARPLQLRFIDRPRYLLGMRRLRRWPLSGGGDQRRQ